MSDLTYPNHQISIEEFEKKWGNLSEMNPLELTKRQRCELIADFAFIPEFRDEALDHIYAALVMAKVASHE